MPLEQRFHTTLTTAPRRWTGGGVLRIIPRGQPLQVIHFWTPTGEFAGWYLNFETPCTRMGSLLTTRDWHLDLWIDPAGVST